MYYMYGAALLCKAQEDVDPLGLGAPGEQPAAGKAKPGAAGAPAAAAASAGGEEEEDDEESEEGEEAGPQDDLQLAFENLDSARVIFAAAGAARCEELAQCHLKIGQVLAEQGLFEQSLSEYDSSLVLFNRVQPPPHRRISGLFADAATALEQLQRPAEALQRFRLALAAMEARLAEVRASAEGGAHPEAAELQRTLHEMRLREEELRESLEDEIRTKEALKRTLAGMAGITSGAAGGSVFDAPKMGAAGAAADLGVVGRGVGRVGAPAPAGGAGPAQVTTVRRAPVAAAAPPAAPVTAAAAAAPKRPLEGGVPPVEAKQAKATDEGCTQQ